MTEIGPTADPPVAETPADKMRLEEFRLLRGEIELRASEQRAMERNVILLSASIYGFLLYPKGHEAGRDLNYLALAWYLPSLFSFLALVRWRESVKMIAALSEYIKQLEATVFVTSGWENFLAEKRAKGELPLTSPWYLVFWTVTCVGTLVLAFVRVHPRKALVGMDATLIASIGCFFVWGLVHRASARSTAGTLGWLLDRFCPGGLRRK
jgi:hypothetical protein